MCNIQWGNGDFAPGVNEGEKGKWLCGHNLLLSHAAAVKVGHGPSVGCNQQGSLLVHRVEHGYCAVHLPSSCEYTLPLYTPCLNLTPCSHANTQPLHWPDTQTPYANPHPPQPPQVYRGKFKAQKGKIGMALWSEWSEPYTDAPEGAGLPIH